MIAALVLAAALSAQSDCLAVPGANALFDRPRANVIWVGETHGTSEEPVLFADLVCAASATGRPVIVALERSDAEQAAWDAFLASDGSAASEAQFLNMWEPTPDGRSSLAMLALAHRLRAFKAQGRIVGVRLIRPDGSKIAGDHFAQQYETAMAAKVAAARAVAPNALLIVYTGSAHARKDARAGDDGPYSPAAALLPPEDFVFSVLLKSGPGSAWVCVNTECGPHEVSASEPARARAVVIGPADGADAIAFTGTATTASPPAVQPRANLLRDHL